MWLLLAACAPEPCILRPGFHADLDGDGYGTPAPETRCDVPVVTNTTDCDDTRAEVTPGGYEHCFTDLDDDCSGSTNDADAVGCATWYIDIDGDVLGNPNFTRCTCEAERPYTTVDASDCDDSDAELDCARVVPAAEADARLWVDEGWYGQGDADGDGDVDVIIDEEIVDPRVLLSGADGEVVAETGSASHPAAVGDLDGDGILDLVTTTSEELYDGSFARVLTVKVFAGPWGEGTPAAGARWDWTAEYCVETGAVATADLDGDGIGDLLREQPDAGIGCRVSFLPEGGSSGTSDWSTLDYFRKADGTTDMDGDGSADLVVLRERLEVLPGPLVAGAEPTDTLTLPDGETPETLHMGDVDGDGHPDLALGGETGWVVLGPPEWTTEGLADEAWIRYDNAFDAAFLPDGDGGDGVVFGDGYLVVFDAPTSGVLDRHDADRVWIGTEVDAVNEFLGHSLLSVPDADGTAILLATVESDAVLLLASP